MHIRLNDTDVSRVVIAQDFFARQPVPIHMGGAEIVRVALRELLEIMGKLDDAVAVAHADIENRTEGANPQTKKRRKVPRSTASAKAA